MFFIFSGWAQRANKRREDADAGDVYHFSQCVLDQALDVEEVEEAQTEYEEGDKLEMEMEDEEVDLEREFVAYEEFEESGQEETLSMGERKRCRWKWS